jgi:DnaJ-class molecular chaperone
VSDHIFVCQGYRLCLFLRFVFSILELFRQCGTFCHPDVNREDPKTHDKFIRLKDAYSVIGNVATRREYDRELAVQLQYHAQNARRSGYDAMYKPGWS